MSWDKAPQAQEIQAALGNVKAQRGPISDKHVRNVVALALKHAKVCTSPDNVFAPTFTLHHGDSHCAANPGAFVCVARAVFQGYYV